MEYEFDAVIQEGRKGGAWIEFPYDVKAEFGTGGQVKVKATFDGIPYRGSLAPMGGGKHVLGMLKEIREALNKQIGDTVRVALSRDTEERVLELPEELQAAFREHPAAKAAFDKLSPSRQREQARSVAEAKKPETRMERARKIIEGFAKD